MALTAEEYRQQLESWLPPGPAWEILPGDTLDQLLASLSKELARVDRRSSDLLTESDPRSTYEMLPNWESALGLPDECTVGTPGLSVRIARLVSKLTGLGGQSRAFFISLAASLGYPGASIKEYKPFTCTSYCTDSLTGGDWLFAWMLSMVQSTRITVMTCGGSCNESLRAWGDTELECVVRKLAPAHSIPLFKYAS